MFKKYSIHLFIPLVLLIMFVPEFCYTQDLDTITIDESSVESPIYYSAEDSIYSDLKREQIHLFRNASVDNGEIKINAGYILIDLKKNEVFATYIFDADSNQIQKPQFIDGGDNFEASSIRYNFSSEKGFIEDVAIKQDESYLYMDIAKRHNNEEIHFRKGRFTTCDLSEPHYHFQLSKAVMVPEKRIVSGPMNLWIKGVPTPIGLPFSVIPQAEDRTNGLIFPEIVPLSQFGFGLQDIGYYLPISDNFQTTFYGSIYSRGSWGIRNLSDYAKRYKFSGNLNLGFQQFKSGFPSNVNQNKISINWTHRKDPKGNPYWNFSSNVNFISDNNSQNNLDPLNETYFNNTLSSDINLNRNFPGKPITSGLKLSMRQNSITNIITLTSPILNVNVTRFFPLKKYITGSSGWKQLASRLGVTYNFEGQNRSTFGDTSLINGDFDRIGEQFQNGISQNATIQTTAGLFKNTLKITPSISYGNKMNFQQTRKSYSSIDNTTLTDTIQKFGMAHNLSFNAQLTTALFSYYKFIGKNEALLRHVLTPSFTFQYVPDLNPLITDSVGVDKLEVSYSPFERSLYNVGNTKDQAIISFGFNNTFELKRKSTKDTITGYKKTRIIDALSINGTYDLLKDSMNLSNIRINLRVSPIKWLNFVASSSFSPYDWIDSTGATVRDYAIVSRGTLGRFLSNNFATTLTLTSSESRKKIESSVQDLEATWTSDYTYFALHPEQIINFEIPWKLSISHIYSINANQNISEYNAKRWNQTQTLMFNGDFSFTKRWKLVSTVNFDIEDALVTNARFSLTRDMHCWALAFHWTPIGGNKSFLFSIRSTSTLFRDAKIDIRKPPAFL